MGHVRGRGETGKQVGQGNDHPQQDHKDPKDEATSSPQARSFPFKRNLGDFIRSTGVEDPLRGFDLVLLASDPKAEPILGEAGIVVRLQLEAGEADVEEHA
jgi:hypothetical protein